MLKIFIIVFFCLFYQENIYSQTVHTGKSESIEGRALYTLSHLKDTTQTENIYILKRWNCFTTGMRHCLQAIQPGNRTR